MYIGHDSKMIYHLVTISYFYIENIIVFSIEIPLRFIAEINAEFVVFIFVGKVNIIPLFIIVFFYYIILYCTLTMQKTARAILQRTIKRF